VRWYDTHICVVIQVFVPPGLEWGGGDFAERFGSELAQRVTGIKIKTKIQ
jgi:hypothetical protein